MKKQFALSAAILAVSVLPAFAQYTQQEEWGGQPQDRPMVSPETAPEGAVGPEEVTPGPQAAAPESLTAPPHPDARGNVIQPEQSLPEMQQDSMARQ